MGSKVTETAAVKYGYCQAKAVTTTVKGPQQERRDPGIMPLAQPLFVVQ